MLLPSLRLPSLQRLVPPRPHRRLPALRCSGSSNTGGEEGPLSDDASSNQLRRFSSSAGGGAAGGGERSGSGGSSASASASSSSSSSSNSSSASSSVFKGFGKDPNKDKPSATDALISSLAATSGAQGRESRSNNIIVGSDQTEEQWRELDGQVNEYPGQRTFKAIGSGGQDFVDAMVACAEKVVGPLHEECVSQRPSTKGNYVSVTISVWVESPDQVIEIYGLMKDDSRLRFFF